ncbi:IclR family transcriptional regulator [Ligilactobacillus equi DPC 6820]|uniref:IclR family transcriptional regulator n=2 Tax=Ligilactobacillus equi TaxID=137357 RepID=V7HVJ3_9LACO|nr:IclR family transcriptional regulator [Ligilactobacillus equi DPC 6820]
MKHGYMPVRRKEGGSEMEKLGTTLTLVALVFTFLGAGLIEQNTTAGGWCAVIGVVSLVGVFALDEKTQR